jgi:hypothetical protein
VIRDLWASNQSTTLRLSSMAGPSAHRSSSMVDFVMEGTATKDGMDTGVSDKPAILTIMTTAARGLWKLAMSRGPASYPSPQGTKFSRCDSTIVIFERAKPSAISEQVASCQNWTMTLR